MRHILFFIFILGFPLLARAQIKPEYILLQKAYIEDMFKSRKWNKEEKLCDCKMVHSPTDIDKWLLDENKSIGLYCALRMAVISTEGKYQHRGSIMNFYRKKARALIKKYHLHPINGYNKELKDLDELLKGQFFTT